MTAANCSRKIATSQGIAERWEHRPIVACSGRASTRIGLTQSVGTAWFVRGTTRDAVDLAQSSTETWSFRPECLGSLLKASVLRGCTFRVEAVPKRDCRPSRLPAAACRTGGGSHPAAVILSIAHKRCPGQRWVRLLIRGLPLAPAHFVLSASRMQQRVSLARIFAADPEQPNRTHLADPAAGAISYAYPGARGPWLRTSLLLTTTGTFAT